jgi:hypothetical protein
MICLLWSPDKKEFLVFFNAPNMKKYFHLFIFVIDQIRGRDKIPFKKFLI